MLGVGSPVVFRLKAASRFAQKIVFIPTVGIFSLMFSPHPILEKLRNLVKTAIEIEALEVKESESDRRRTERKAHRKKAPNLQIR